jgi:hypothetical protein
MLTTGDPAPVVTLKTITGETVSLVETWRSGCHTLLIFLRHLG